MIHVKKVRKQLILGSFFVLEGDTVLIYHIHQVSKHSLAQSHQYSAKRCFRFVKQTAEV